MSLGFTHAHVKSWLNTDGWVMPICQPNMPSFIQTAAFVNGHLSFARRQQWSAPK
jgi:hypothetical protein